MEVLSNVLQVAETIYSLCERASSNKKQCARLQKKVKMLLLTAGVLGKQHGKSKELKVVLTELELTLKNAECWVQKYSQRVWWRKVIQANGIKEEFDLINDRLTDAATVISSMMLAEQRESFLKFFDEKHRKRQNERDTEADLAELKDYLRNEFQPKAQDILSHVAAMKAYCLRTSWDIKEIRSTDLTVGELVIERPSHFLYRGEYHKGPVAIKVLKGQLIKDNDYVRKVFQSESETMKKFECGNILRLFGICIDNSKSEPCYSLVMEFCEKGTLRDLLNRERGLPWEQRVSMVLDAARALYRLHHSEMKAILHGSLSSSKFLVDGTYCLKLAGFELSKTESSMRRTSNSEKRKNSIGWAYMAPETLKNINAYNKRSEIYSLGVVLYEIASGNVPLAGLTDPEKHLDELHRILTAEVATGLPTDCPKILSDIITQSLESDPTKRPTAGVIVDLLIAHQNQPNSPIETTV
ncbi:mixed lineage kinase domain-like protein [Pelobates fuscus]|uniref:mixed lineage kinase domain-like protein n=1 Tax=Pelobates fuscus TaxID=191477 RepID=UPI002FE49E05